MKEEDNKICGYSNNSIMSLLDNMLISDCSLNEGSFDQIAQFNLSASAKGGISLSCGEIDFASDSNALYSSKEKLDTYFPNSLIADSTCSTLNFEYFNKSDLLSLNSCRLYAAVNNSKPSKPEFTMINLTGLSLKNENKMLVSTTSLIYHPSDLCLSQTRSLILSPSLRQSSSVNSDLSSILSNFLSNKALLTFSDKNSLIAFDRLSSGNSSICFFNSSGMDKVMFGIFNSHRIHSIHRYLRFLLTNEILEFLKKYKDCVIFISVDNNQRRVAFKLK